jgi:hypothetical protein
MGPVPIQLNPAPRHPGQRPLLIDGAEHGPEVVWANRLGPAHAVITTVPLPESGHRYGDVLLHDGEPVGTRTLPDGSSVPVFDELERLVPGPHPTTAVTVTAPTAADLASLVDSLADAGLAAEDWTTSVRELCADHADGAPEAPTEPSGERSVGIAGEWAGAAEVLGRWAGSGGGRSWRRSPGSSPGVG